MVVILGWEGLAGGAWRKETAAEEAAAGKLQSNRF
jgi:hypothetical protein